MSDLHSCVECSLLGSWCGAAQAYLRLSESDRITAMARIAQRRPERVQWYAENLAAAVEIAKREIAAPSHG